MNPKAKKLKILGEFLIEIQFSTGEIKSFDVQPLFKYPVYECLKSNEFFKKVFISDGVVQWPNELDTSPDLLYMDSKKVS
jgi:hypothetical protein